MPFFSKGCYVHISTYVQIDLKHGHFQECKVQTPCSYLKQTWCIQLKPSDNKNAQPNFPKGKNDMIELKTPKPKVMGVLSYVMCFLPMLEWLAKVEQGRAWIFLCVGVYFLCKFLALERWIEA
jgi:hypothetical protein